MKFNGLRKPHFVAYKKRSFWSADLSSMYLWSKKILLLSRNSKEWYLIMLWDFFFSEEFYVLYISAWLHISGFSLRKVVRRNCCVDMFVSLSFKAVSPGSLLIWLKHVLFPEHSRVNRNLCTMTNCWLFSLYHFLKLIDATWRWDFPPGLGKILPSWVRFTLRSCSFPSAPEGDSALPFTRHPEGHVRKQQT